MFSDCAHSKTRNIILRFFESSVSLNLMLGHRMAFVMVNDHLTLALKSFTGQAEMEREREEEGGNRREAHSLQEAGKMRTARTEER